MENVYWLIHGMKTDFTEIYMRILIAEIRIYVRVTENGVSN